KWTVVDFSSSPQSAIVRLTLTDGHTSLVTRFDRGKMVFIDPAPEELLNKAAREELLRSLQRCLSCDLVSCLSGRGSGGEISWCTSREAVALIMREVICEQIYREREHWNPHHPNRSLGIRSITPEEILPYARNVYLKLDKEQLRAQASEILDLII